MNFPDKQALEQYYIIENHSLDETSAYFSITMWRLHKLLDNYNLKKPSLKAFLNTYTYEEIFKKYILENCDFETCVNYFQTTRDILKEALKRLNINKSIEISKRKTTCLEKAHNIDKDNLYEYYVLQNHTQDETAQFFDIRVCDLVKLINEYKFFKLSKFTYKENKKDKVDELISLELLEDLYINKNHTIKQCADILNVSVHNINRLVKKYKLNKELDLIHLTAKRSKMKKSNYLGDAKLFATYSKEYQDLYYDKEKSEQFLSKTPLYTARELSKRFNCKPIDIYNWVKRHNLRHLIRDEKSHYEQEIIDYILSIDPQITIRRNKRYSFMEYKELDIYLPDYKLAIEFNGIYWHSDKVIEDKKYHFNKSKLADNNEIHLMHIYEYEWLNETKKNIIKTLIKLKLNKIDNRIYARKCIVKEISNKEAKPFNDLNHLQGHRNAQITLGLFYQDNLVQLMSFSRTKYNRNLKNDNEWEIIRGCPGSANLIVGGVSKLMNHFIKTYKPNLIFSYCDFNKFDGKSYLLAGMEFYGFTGPDKKYIIDGEVKNRNPFKYNQIKDKIEYTIYGSGSKKYILNLRKDGDAYEKICKN